VDCDLRLIKNKDIFRRRETDLRLSGDMEEVNKRVKCRVDKRNLSGNSFSVKPN
jgi:hypothetical protein